MTSFKFILMALLFATRAFSQEQNSEWSDLKESFTWLFQGSYLQFTQKNNLYYAAAATPSIWYAFENDDRIQARYGGTEIANIVDHIGDAGVAFNFPILHLGFYYYGRNTGQNREVQFAKEYFASMYLALIETGLMSYIDVHKRPVPGDVSFWESEFRGDSSWPSGHTIPYAALFFKTMQFYGPGWAAIPFILTIASSMQRVQDQKHWLSDVTTSFFLAAFASEGVRAAGKSQFNHPFYRAVFEHDVKVGIIRHQGVMGPRLAWSF
ncbi:MAG: hypothetical protein OHK0056_13990 [Bacteriovoracaceae bacterium]